MKPNRSANLEQSASAESLSAGVWSRREWLVYSTGLGLLWPQLQGCAWNCPPPTECRDVSYLTSPEGFSYFIDPLYLQRRPRRVLLAATSCQRQPFELQSQFVEQLASSLREAQLFEVITDHRLHGCNCDLDAVLHGYFNERHLLSLTEQYNCEALMLTRVNQFDFNWPMKTAVTVVLIDRAEAVVLVAVDGLWDIGSPDLARSYTSFVLDQNQLVPKEFLQVNQQSPRQLQRFVAWQISRLLVSQTG
jgi:hypothetical protein